jgi:hypothetical protein
MDGFVITNAFPPFRLSAKVSKQVVVGFQSCSQMANNVSHFLSIKMHPVRQGASSHAVSPEKFKNCLKVRAMWRCPQHLMTTIMEVLLLHFAFQSVRSLILEAT